SCAQDSRSALPPAPVQSISPALPVSLSAQSKTIAIPAAAEDGTLTRQQAEQLALRNNPRISVAALLAQDRRQKVRETRSAELPALNGNLTGVDAEEASRISSGSLTASRLLYHAGAG